MYSTGLLDCSYAEGNAKQGNSMVDGSWPDGDFAICALPYMMNKTKENGTPTVQ